MFWRDPEGVFEAVLTDFDGVSRNLENDETYVLKIGFLAAMLSSACIL